MRRRVLTRCLQRCSSRSLVPTSVVVGAQPVTVGLPIQYLPIGLTNHGNPPTFIRGLHGLAQLALGHLPSEGRDPRRVSRSAELESVNRVEVGRTNIPQRATKSTTTSAAFGTSAE